MSVGLISFIKRLDAYPKTLEDFRIQTPSGGTITIISSFIMIFLFASEIKDFVQPQFSEEIFVDTSRVEKLKINFDVVIHLISCDYLSLDAMDISGEQHIDIKHNIFKRRLDLKGKPIDDPRKEDHFGEKAKIINKTEDNQVINCGSCYGAETDDMKCCNTCDDVKKAYNKKTWKFDPRGISQCEGDYSIEMEKRALSEGCQIYGFLEVNRVGGSFHIGPGRSFSINHVHVHDVQPFSSNDFNLTHSVRHLSFGKKIEGKESPLDNLLSVADKGSTMFQYYLKIVPTTYSRSDGSYFLTNQYSVTRHKKAVSLLTGEVGMPGVFFSYELAPFMVKYSEKKKNFGHFATGLCAIIGGIFTVAGILDKLVYTSSKIIQKKVEIGKVI